MHNSLTSISLEKTIQSSLQLDAEKSKKKRQKLTIESVRQHIESFGYRLLSTQYGSVSTKLEIICPNQHRYLASYNHFQQGQRCPECARNKKLTIESVRQHVESFGYKLTSIEYVNSSTKLEIICPMGHLFKSPYNSFQKGSRCAECAGLKKHTIDAVKQYIESFKGYRLLSTVYVGSNEKLDLVCPNQHMYRVSHSNFQQGHRCPECSSNAKHRLSNVKAYIESFGYRLRSTVYVGANAKLDILCPNQHLYKVSYGKFQEGARCPECYNISKRRTMPNGEDWEPYIRRSQADIAWRKAVLKRDARTCQACFYPSKEIHAHHIESYARNPELQTDINNGVTLCKSCHTAIHSRYGKMTATRSDLAEFTRLKCR